MNDGKPPTPTEPPVDPCAVLILPGINGSGDQHWQTMWEGILPRARRVHARDWCRPNCADWTAALERAVADAGPDVMLVAHSLGCLQVAHWAQQTRLSVGGALLVAPPDPSGPAFPREAVGFTPLPAGPLPFPSTLVASMDDPYATARFSLRCAEIWGSRFVDIGCHGHVNVESGLRDWPQGRALLNQLVIRRYRP